MQLETPAYPVQILPQKGWRDDLNIKAIIETNENAVIGRKIIGSPEMCIDSSLGEDNARLRVKYLKTSEIPNLSTSILGALFSVEDFVFWQKEEGEKPWKKEEVVEFEKYSAGIDYYPESESIIVVGWRIKAIHGYLIPYNKIIPKQKDYETLREKTSDIERLREKYALPYESLPVDADGKRYMKMNGEARVNHAPVKLNYWHHTIDLYPEDTPENPLKGIKGAWKEMMGENVADYLRRSFLLIKENSADFTISGWEGLVAG